MTDFFKSLYKRIVEFMNAPGMRRPMAMMLTLFLCAANLYAMRQRSGGYQRGYLDDDLYFDPATKLIYAIGAVVGLIGGVKVYGKFSSGDPDTSKTAASWFGACIFLIVAATILRSFFL